MTTPSMDLATLSGGLLILRLMLGLSMAAHGAQKLFGWFHGPGLTGTGGIFEGLGFRPGKPYAVADGFAETVSGLLVAFGLFGPIGPGLMISGMVVAIGSVHWRNGFFVTNNGFETPLLYAIGALALAFTGFGQYSLDTALGLQELASPLLAIIAVLAGVLGGFAMLAVRHPPPPKPTEMHG
jgi:putative oxidoreductase